MKRLSLALAALVVVAVFPHRPAAAAPSSIDGLWDAIVVAAGTEVPFRFEIATKGSEAQGFFFEGDRKVGSTRRDIRGRRAEARVRPPEHHPRSLLERRHVDRHVPE